LLRHSFVTLEQKGAILPWLLHLNQKATIFPRFLVFLGIRSLHCVQQGALLSKKIILALHTVVLPAIEYLSNAIKVIGARAISVNKLT
jgi:hypothetical protein